MSRRTGNGGDQYWQSACQQLMRNTIDLCILAVGEVTVWMMSEVVRSAPKSIEEKQSKEWREKSLCWKLLEKAYGNDLGKWEELDLNTIAAYWLEEYPSISDKTRSGIVSMFTSLIDPLLRRPFRMLFSEPPENPEQIAYPELTHHGMIIVMDLSVKEYGDAGRMSQLIYKYMWQQAAERRDIKANPRPVFLWADEAQNFVTDYDMHFQATARSSRACTVYLTQNLPNYFAELGNRDRVHSLVGNLQTKIWHANSDPETNNFASEVVGKSWHQRSGQSQSLGGQSFSFSESKQDSYDYDVHPQLFTRLPKGGPLNDFIVGAIVFQNGRTWTKGETYLLTAFKQQKL